MYPWNTLPLCLGLSQAKHAARPLFWGTASAIHEAAKERCSPNPAATATMRDTGTRFRLGGVVVDAVTLGSRKGAEELGADLPPAGPLRPPETAIRVACHLAGATIFLVALVADLVHGWLPTGDDAIIAQRAWGVFTAHPPLVGQFSQASGAGHTVYDPGPLLFWLLAVPVRLDPTHGVLWGSALLCLAGVALAVEAAWAFRGTAAAAAVVIVFAVVASTQAFVAVNPAWNASIGVVWFITTIALTLTVASGRLRWWPALVGAASVTAQSHLEFATTAVGLVLLGLGLGLARHPRPRRWGWLAGGLGIGALCWAAPLIEELTGRPGNLSVIWDWLGHRPTYGAKFGFQCLASVAGPHPLWLTRQNRGSNADAFLGLLSHILDRSELSGVAVLAALVLIVVGGWLFRRRDIATLASVTVLAAAMAVWTFSSLPRGSILTIVYSDIVLWPVGMLVWLVWLWTAAAIGSAAFRALRRRFWHPALPPAAEFEANGSAEMLAEVPGAAPVQTPGTGERRSRARLRWLAATGVLLVGAIGATVAASTVPNPHLGVLGGWASVDLVPLGAAAVDRALPRGPIAVYADGSDNDIDYSVAYGVVWQLRHEGRSVTAPNPHWQPLGAAAAPSPTEPRITVHIHNNRTVTVTGFPDGNSQ